MVYDQDAPDVLVTGAGLLPRNGAGTANFKQSPDRRGGPPDQKLPPVSIPSIRASPPGQPSLGRRRDVEAAYQLIAQGEQDRKAPAGSSGKKNAVFIATFSIDMLGMQAKADTQLSPRAMQQPQAYGAPAWRTAGLGLAPAPQAPQRPPFISTAVHGPLPYRHQAAQPPRRLAAPLPPPPVMLWGGLPPPPAGSPPQAAYASPLQGGYAKQPSPQGGYAKQASPQGGYAKQASPSSSSLPPLPGSEGNKAAPPAANGYYSPPRQQQGSPGGSGNSPGGPHHTPVKSTVTLSRKQQQHTSLYSHLTSQRTSPFGAASQASGAAGMAPSSERRSNWQASDAISAEFMLGGDAALASKLHGGGVTWMDPADRRLGENLGNFRSNSLGAGGGSPAQSAASLPSQPSKRGGSLGATALSSPSLLTPASGLPPIMGVTTARGETLRSGMPAAQPLPGPAVPYSVSVVAAAPRHAAHSMTVMQATADTEVLLPVGSVQAWGRSELAAGRAAALATPPQPAGAAWGGAEQQPRSPTHIAMSDQVDGVLDDMRQDMLRAAEVAEMAMQPEPIRVDPKEQGGDATVLRLFAEAGTPLQAAEPPVVVDDTADLHAAVLSAAASPAPAEEAAAPAPAEEDADLAEASFSQLEPVASQADVHPEAQPGDDQPPTSDFAGDDGSASPSADAVPAEVAAEAPGEEAFSAVEAAALQPYAVEQVDTQPDAPSAAAYSGSAATESAAAAKIIASSDTAEGVFEAASAADPAVEEAAPGPTAAAAGPTSPTAAAAEPTSPTSREDKEALSEQRGTCPEPETAAPAAEDASSTPPSSSALQAVPQQQQHSPPPAEGISEQKPSLEEQEQSAPDGQPPPDEGLGQQEPPAMLSQEPADDAPTQHPSASPDSSITTYGAGPALSEAQQAAAGPAATATSEEESAVAAAASEEAAATADEGDETATPSAGSGAAALEEPNPSPRPRITFDAAADDAPASSSFRRLPTPAANSPRLPPPADKATAGASLEDDAEHEASSEQPGDDQQQLPVDEEGEEEGEEPGSDDITGHDDQASAAEEAQEEEGEEEASVGSGAVVGEGLAEKQLDQQREGQADADLQEDQQGDAQEQEGGAYAEEGDSGDVVDADGHRLLAQCYQVEHTVGEGAYGVVMKCKDIFTGEYVAIKEFKIEDSDPDAEDVRRTARREVALLQELQHPNVVRLIREFSVRQRLFIAMEFLPCNLLELLESHEAGLDKEAIRLIMFQIIVAIAHIHGKGVVYRDIKPENVLVDGVGRVKLCDFGFARHMPGPHEPLTEYVATRWYRSPELLLGPPWRQEDGSIVQSRYTFPIDMWAIGCLMGELTDGKPLFAGDSDIDQLFQVTRMLGNLIPRHQEAFQDNPHNEGFSCELEEPPSGLAARYEGMLDAVELDFMSGLLHMDPQQRFTATQCLRHPYLAELWQSVSQDLSHLAEIEALAVQHRHVQQDASGAEEEDPEAHGDEEEEAEAHGEDEEDAGAANQEDDDPEE